MFNFSRWVARQVTDPKKNVDQKIFIVGPAGSGKSMAGLALAQAVSKWISFYNHEGNLSHASEYFSFDEDHIAVIDNQDLIRLMTTYPKRNSVRIIDDCGAATGFTNRRSMSTENLDLVSIYGTNRVRNCVTIVCVQDTNFTDIRMRVLANEIIDLRDWFQQGPLRFGKLWRIRMDNKAKRGFREVRFMTYTHGQWSTCECIACNLPTPSLIAQYDELRERKDRENTLRLSEKYNTTKEKNNYNKERCPKCGSAELRYRQKTHDWKCKPRGHIFTTPA
jgi:hypothetical protein